MLTVSLGFSIQAGTTVSHYQSIYLCKVVSYSGQRGAKWINFPLTTPATPLFPGAVVSCCRASPPRLGVRKFGSLLRNSIWKQGLPVAIQAANCRWPCRTSGCGCRVGESSRLFSGCNRIGCLQHISKMTLYHACACHVGVMRTIIAWTFWIFARQRHIIEKGEKL